MEQKLNTEHSQQQQEQLTFRVGKHIKNHALRMLIVKEKTKNAPSYFGKLRETQERPTQMDQLVMTGNNLHVKILACLLQAILTTRQLTNSVHTISTSALSKIQLEIQPCMLVHH